MPAAIGSSAAEPASSFAPEVAADTRVLILGSIPGRASLAAGQYYAHPRNAFWPILGSLLGFDPALPYPDRLARLKERGIGLFDVVASCARRGSLDQGIDRESIRWHALPELVAGLPELRRIAANGAMAARGVDRAWPGLVALRPGLERLRLPSTSPAHASRSRAEKLAAWRALLEPFEC